MGVSNQRLIYLAIKPVVRKALSHFAAEQNLTAKIVFVYAKIAKYPTNNSLYCQAYHFLIGNIHLKIFPYNISPRTVFVAS